MILHGRNLIIKSGGVAIAAAKSCTIDVKADTIPAANPLSGKWQLNLPGLQSWQVNVGTLVMPKVSDQLQVLSHTTTSEGFVAVNGIKYQETTRGFNFAAFLVEDEHLELDMLGVCDPSDASRQLTADLEQWLNDYPPEDYPSVVFVNSSTPIPEAESGVWQMLKDAYGVTFNTPSATRAASFALFSSPGDAPVIKTSLLGTEQQFTRELYQGRVVNQAGPLRNAILSVGEQVQLTMTVRHPNGEDTVCSGNAICTRYSASGTVGSLANGNFSFIGSGALE